MTLQHPAGHWIDALAAADAACVAVALAEAEGSTPREAGARMLVSEAAVTGTIGGGQLEYQAIALAREFLARPDRPVRAVRRFALGPSLGQCCGGATTLLLERFDLPHPDWVGEAARRRAAGETLVLATPLPAADEDGVPGPVPVRLIGRRDAGCVAGLDGAPAALRGPARELIESSVEPARLVPAGAGRVLLERLTPDSFHVMLFGAGHVGQAIVAALGLLPCRVTWVDDRPQQFPERIPGNVAALHSTRPELEVRGAPAGASFLVMTHSHALDQDVCEEVLRRGDFAYLGLIGSATKRAMFQRRLAQRGIPAEEFARITCPIGIPGIHGKEPAVIAAAVAAELLLVREARLESAKAAGAGGAAARADAVPRAGAPHPAAA